MPKTLTPQDRFPTEIQGFPTLGDPVAIEPLEAAIQAVLDRTENLHQFRLRVEAGEFSNRVVDSLTELSGLTDVEDGQIVEVIGYGRYRYQASNGPAPAEPWVVASSAGGVWIHMLYDLKDRDNGLATLDENRRLAQEPRDRSIYRHHINYGAVGPDELGDGVVHTRHIASGAVGYFQLSNFCIDTDKIIEGAVTASKIADGAVTEPKLGLRDGPSHKIGPFRIYLGNQDSDPKGILFGVRFTTSGTMEREFDSGPLGMLSFEIGGVARLRTAQEGGVGTGFDWHDAIVATLEDVKVAGHLHVSQKLFVHDGLGNTGTPAISIAIGNRDTGLNWDPAGAVHMMIGGIARARWDGYGLMSRYVYLGNPSQYWVWSIFGDELTLGYGSEVSTGKREVVAKLTALPQDAIRFHIHAVPNLDNTYTLGREGLRWASIWAATGTIQTSDARQKTDIQPCPLGLDFIERLQPVAYRWKIGGYVEEGEPEVEEVQVPDGVDEEGNPVYRTVKRIKPRYVPRPGRRLHHGLIAQQVKEVLDQFGVDFGGWILANPDDPDSEQGLRYDQFIAPIIKAIQELSAKVKALEAKITGGE